MGFVTQYDQDRHKKSHCFNIPKTKIKTNLPTTSDETADDDDAADDDDWR